MEKKLKDIKDPVLLKKGLHCRACDSSLGDRGDPELCHPCMRVVRELIYDVDSPDEEGFYVPFTAEVSSEQDDEHGNPLQT